MVKKKFKKGTPDMDFHDNTIIHWINTVTDRDLINSDGELTHDIEIIINKIKDKRYNGN